MFARPSIHVFARLLSNERLSLDKRTSVRRPSAKQNETKNVSLQVFAPADFAFESIGITNETVLTFDLDVLSSVLSYHIVPNQAVDNSTLQGPLREFQTLLPGRVLRNSLDGGLLDGTGMKANVLAADLQAVNGYLHAIDAVLEWYPLFTQSPTSAPTAAPILRDLVDTLVIENADRDGEYFGQFDTMIAALSVTEFHLELEQPGPFTVGLHFLRLLSWPSPFFTLFGRGW